MPEWHPYDSARILLISPPTGMAEIVVDYVTPVEARPEDGGSVLFKAATRVGNLLYACTSTEVILYSLPDFQVKTYLSHPAFNDVHATSEPLPTW